MTEAKYLGLTANELAKIASDIDAENAKLREQGARLFDKTLELGTENASLRGAVKGLGDLCDKYKEENAKLRMCLGDGCADCAVGMGEYADSLCDPLKADNADLRERIAELEYERVMMFLELAGEWIRVKQREMEEGQ